MFGERYGAWVAAAVAACFAAVTTCHAFFVGTIADGSGYVSEAARWLSGNLLGPAPFAFWPSWLDVNLGVPLGYRLGPMPGTDVFAYPPGLPLTMAAAMAGGSELFAHLVPPLLGGLMVWATGELAGQLSGTRARVLGAALMATSAIALVTAIGPMSDVPASAWWALSLALVIRARPLAVVAAGLSVSMAILTRPNLAPLVVIPMLFAWSASQVGRWPRTALFLICAAIGPIVLLWAQQQLYGSPLAPGHQGIEQLFALGHIQENLTRYLRWYAEAHTPAAALAVLAPLVFWRSPALGLETRITPRFLTLGLLAFAVGVHAAYLPYFPYNDWPFLRFMLPALPAVYALTAAIISRGIDRLPGRLQRPAFVVVLALTAGLQARQAVNRNVADEWRSNRRVLTAVHYLDAALPRNALVVTFFHSGSVRYYTGRPIVRPDVIPPEQFDALVARFAQAGYATFLLLDDELERAAFVGRFAQSRFGTLAWPARARIGTYGHLSLYDLADRERHARGERWATDVLP